MNGHHGQGAEVRPYQALAPAMQSGAPRAAWQLPPLRRALAGCVRGRHCGTARRPRPGKALAAPMRR
eukprot:6816789-Lingulodinium_polyedra.AAC.1